MTLTLSEEESGTARGGIFVTLHMQLPGQDGRATEELRKRSGMLAAGRGRREDGKKIRTTPTSVSGCLSTIELKTLSQFGRPK